MMASAYLKHMALPEAVWSGTPQGMPSAHLLFPCAAECSMFFGYGRCAVYLCDRSTVRGGAKGVKKDTLGGVVH
jgi:hypothetical protein